MWREAALSNTVFQICKFSWGSLNCYYSQPSFALGWEEHRTNACTTTSTCSPTFLWKPISISDTGFQGLTAEVKMQDPGLARTILSNWRHKYLPEPKLRLPEDICQRYKAASQFEAVFIEGSLERTGTKMHLNPSVQTAYQNHQLRHFTFPFPRVWWEFSCLTC